MSWFSLISYLTHLLKPREKWVFVGRRTPGTNALLFPPQRILSFHKITYLFMWKIENIIISNLKWHKIKNILITATIVDAWEWKWKKWKKTLIIIFDIYSSPSTVAKCKANRRITSLIATYVSFSHDVHAKSVSFVQSLFLLMRLGICPVGDAFDW